MGGQRADEYEAEVAVKVVESARRHLKSETVAGRIQDDAGPGPVGHVSDVVRFTLREVDAALHNLQAAYTDARDQLRAARRAGLVPHDHEQCRADDGRVTPACPDFDRAPPPPDRYAVQRGEEDSRHVAIAAILDTRDAVTAALITERCPYRAGWDETSPARVAAQQRVWRAAVEVAYRMNRGAPAPGLVEL